MSLREISLRTYSQISGKITPKKIFLILMRLVYFGKGVIADASNFNKNQIMALKM